MLSPGILEGVLKQVDLATLARAEATCSAIRQIAQSITIDCTIDWSPECPEYPEACTANYMGFIRWMRRHARQFRSVTITTDDPDLANGVGVALADASRLHTLVIHAASYSFTGHWGMVAAMACGATAVPPLRILRLDRGTASTDFLEAFAPTLRTLEITASCADQARGILSLDLPHLEDLNVGMGFPAVVALDSTFTMPGFPKLRHLALKNIIFGQCAAHLTLPADGLETLHLFRCGNLERAGFRGLRVLVSLSVGWMDFPACLDVSDLSELTLFLGAGRGVPSHITFPNLTRFNAEHCDITMRPAQVPKMWSVALGTGCHGDTGWLLDVSRLFHLRRQVTAFT